MFILLLPKKNIKSINKVITIFMKFKDLKELEFLKFYKHLTDVILLIKNSNITILPKMLKAKNCVT